MMPRDFEAPQEPPSEPEPGDDAIIEEMARTITELAALKAKAERERDEARDRLAAVREAAAEVAATGYFVHSAPPEWFEAIKQLRAALVALAAAEKSVAELEAQ